MEVICPNCAALEKGAQNPIDNKQSELSTKEDFVKEAKRFQQAGEKLGGVTLVDIIEHLHEFVSR